MKFFTLLYCLFIFSLNAMESNLKKEDISPSIMDKPTGITKFSDIKPTIEKMKNKQSLSSDKNSTSKQSLSSDENSISKQSLSSDENSISKQSLSSDENSTSKQSLSSDENSTSKQSLSNDENLTSKQSLSNDENLTSRQTVEHKSSNSIFNISEDDFDSEEEYIWDEEKKLDEIHNTEDKGWIFNISK